MPKTETQLHKPAIHQKHTKNENYQSTPHKNIACIHFFIIRKSGVWENKNDCAFDERQPTQHSDKQWQTGRPFIVTHNDQRPQHKCKKSR